MSETLIGAAVVAVALLILLLVPALARWLDQLAEPAPQPVHRGK